jgi:hypothetical protein
VITGATEIETEIETNLTIFQLSTAPFLTSKLSDPTRIATAKKRTRSLDALLVSSQIMRAASAPLGRVWRDKLWKRAAKSER